MSYNQKKANLLKEHLSNPSLFEETIINIHSKEFEKLLSTILTNRSTEFMNILTKNSTATLENIYGPNLLDNDEVIQILQKVKNHVYYKIYLSNFQIIEKTFKDYENSLNAKDNSKLNTLFYVFNFSRHCQNDDEAAYHFCKNALIKVTDPNDNKTILFLICVGCKKVYSPFNFQLNCNKCGNDYTSQLTKMEQSKKSNDSVNNLESLATWDKYHCGAIVNGAMNCIKCKDPLYMNIKSPQSVYCKKCGFQTEALDLFWVCFVCKKEFKCGAKPYDPSEFKDIKECIKEALSSKKRAFPNKVPCCGLDVHKTSFFHKKDCSGLLYFGQNNGKKMIVCEQCKFVKNESTFVWTCPACVNVFSESTSERKKTDSVSNRKGLNISENRGNESDSYSTNAPNHNSKTNNSPDRFPINSNIVQGGRETSGEKNNIMNSPKNNVKKFSIKINQVIKSPESKNAINSPKNDKEKKPNYQNYQSPVKPPINHNKSPSKRSLLSGILTPNNRLDYKQFGSAKKEVNQNHDRKKRESNMFAENLIMLPNEKGINNKKSESLKDRDKHYSPIKIIHEESDQKEINDKNRKLRVINVDDYKTIKQIGEGSYATCYLVIDKNGNQYAMKKILGSSEEEMKLFIDELFLVNSNQHPNILKILGFARKKLDDTTLALYVLMEIAVSDWDNEIKSKITAKSNYSEVELINILVQVVKALAFLQKNNVAHRDIKPQNILVFPGEKYKIADFGEAKQLKNLNKANNTLRGTELYMSPNLFNGMKQGKEDILHNPFKSDVFSLGFCVIYAATLSYAPLYDMRKVYDSQGMRWVISKCLPGKWSNKFINLMAAMLEVKEENRLDFIELENYLNKNFLNI